MNALLWILQALLAAVFIAAGGSKLVLPIDLLTAQIPLPGLVLRCIGLAELCGGLGLVLPGLLGVRPSLTALAAVELAQLMLGATLLTWAVTADAPSTLLPMLLGLLAACVAIGRWRLAPLPAARPRLARLAH